MDSTMDSAVEKTLKADGEDSNNGSDEASWRPKFGGIVKSCNPPMPREVDMFCDIAILHVPPMPRRVDMFYNIAILHLPRRAFVVVTVSDSEAKPMLPPMPREVVTVSDSEAKPMLPPMPREVDMFYNIAILHLPRRVDMFCNFDILHVPPRPRRVAANFRRAFEIRRLAEVTLDSRWKDFILTLMPVPKSFVYDQQSVMMEIKYREQKKKKGKANGKTYKQKYVTMVFKSEKRLSDDRLLKLRNENDIRIMKIQEKFERIIAQLDAKIQHGKRKRQHAPI